MNNNRNQIIPHKYLHSRLQVSTYTFEMSEANWLRFRKKYIPR